MARSRRRHSYRKNRRWNPEIAPGFAAALAKTPVKSTGFSSVAAMPNPKGRRRGMRGGRFTGKPAFRLVTKGPGRYLNNSTDWEDMGGRAAAYVKKYGWPTEGGYQGNPRGRSTRASRARSWHKKVHASLPWWEKGRNPRKGRILPRNWSKLGDLDFERLEDLRDARREGDAREVKRLSKWLRHRKIQVPRGLGRNPRKGSYYGGRVHTRRGRRNPRGHRGHRRKNRRWGAKVGRMYQEYRGYLDKRGRGRHRKKHFHSHYNRNPRGHRGHRRKSRKWTCAGFNGRKRRNPRSGSYYRARKYLRGLPKGRRKHVVSYALGQMNPRRSRTRRGRR